MSQFRRYSWEIVKRILFVLVPVAVFTDPVYRLTNNKNAAIIIMVLYAFVTLLAIRWLSGRKLNNN